MSLTLSKRSRGTVMASVLLLAVSLLPLFLTGSSAAQLSESCDSNNADQPMLLVFDEKKLKPDINIEDVSPPSQKKTTPDADFKVLEGGRRDGCAKRVVKAEDNDPRCPIGGVVCLIEGGLCFSNAGTCRTEISTVEDPITKEKKERCGCSCGD